MVSPLNALADADAPELFARARPPRTFAPFLPVNRREMAALGWERCDIVLITGDAYVDHPSFGMAIVGRLLEAQGFRVGILAQPDWQSAEPFREFGEPRLFFGVTGGNMDSMVNRYTSDRRLRSDDAYTPGGVGGKRPDRAVIVYAQRCREAYREVPIVIGGIEASLRRIAHFDYWSEKIRRSILLDAKADILLYGNAERSIVDLAHRLAGGEKIAQIDDLRGTVFARRAIPADWCEIDSTTIEAPGPLAAPVNPYLDTTAPQGSASEVPTTQSLVSIRRPAVRRLQAQGSRQVIRLPSFESVIEDKVLYAHASRILHREANPGNAVAMVQRHGDREVWINPPPLVLRTHEMDRIYDLPYARVPHPIYGDAKIPAYEMIRFSVTIQRGCFGGCSFCSITEHEGRIIQNRSQESILREVAEIRDRVPGFTGTISDLGGPTANMYRLACKSKTIEQACRRPSCVFPKVCDNLNTDHGPLIELYRQVRAMPGIKKVAIASGVRYDLAVESPEYIKELVTHHVGGYLKIAPEHIAKGPLEQMMKPGVGSYYKFRALFEKFSQQAGKKQYLIPYFIAAHPGTTDEDMLELALWLKDNGYRADQVQAFLPSPMSSATAMYYSKKNPLRPVSRAKGDVFIPAGERQRRLHKAFLRWHDPENWPLLREALTRMGREDLIGSHPQALIPRHQPPPSATSTVPTTSKKAPRKGSFRTQHTGLPPQGGGSTKPGQGRARAKPKR
jgi:uncharacterized radical SAM protein YgiQ